MVKVRRVDLCGFPKAVLVRAAEQLPLSYCTRVYLPSSPVSQIDMAEIKHVQWCRTEIRSAETDLTIAAAGTQNRVQRQVGGILIPIYF